MVKLVAPKIAETLFIDDTLESVAKALNGKSRFIKATMGVKGKSVVVNSSEIIAIIDMEPLASEDIIDIEGVAV
jgi:hypothetical protein